jgi:predicted RNA binding protein YcfA (HicA-like mRNA interferase family)
MPRGVFNWTFDDVVRFLKDHEFKLNHTEGSHFYYIGNQGGQFRQVSVQFHGRHTIKPKTLNSIIRQSGIDRKRWLA